MTSPAADTSANNANTLPSIGGSPPRNADGQQIEHMARAVLEEIAKVGTGVDVQLDEYIHILSQYRSLCEDRENYKEAELVEHVLRHLRTEEETRHVKGLTEQQEMERRGLEEAHMMEFANFNKIWNEKIDKFEEYQLEQESQMIERHSNELAEFHMKMTAEQHHGLKYSKDLLNLRAIQRTLAQQRNYADAQKVKLKGDKIESVELKRISQEKEEIYHHKEQGLLQRQRQELEGLRKRMERGKLELERARKRELEMLLQRYSNVRRGLEAQQNIIRSKTGNLLLKHANNKKTDNSGSQAIIQSMASGVFGPGFKRRQIVGGETVEDDHRDFEGSEPPPAQKEPHST